MVKTLNTGTDPQKIYAAIENAMLANPDLTGILSLECCSTPAAGTWVERNKAADKVKVVGFDLLDQTVQLVQSGNIQATIDQAPEKQGFEAVDLLVKFLKGQADRQSRHRRRHLHQGQHRRGGQEVGCTSRGAGQPVAAARPIRDGRAR